MKKVLLTLLLIVVFAVPAFSEMKDMPMRCHGEGHGQMMEMDHMDMMGGDMMCLAHAEQMGFTDDQIAKMKPWIIQCEQRLNMKRGGEEKWN
jgi:hypothetical protein